LWKLGGRRRRLLLPLPLPLPLVRVASYASSAYASSCSNLMLAWKSPHIATH
jgi:hypothetical protein